MTTTSLYMPDVVVEIAFNAGWATPAASRTWTDVSSYVELQQQIEITHGRGDEFSIADASSLKLTLNNKDGRFTPLRAASPYYPNVKVGRPIRVTATRPGGAASTRFVGFIEGWPPKWDDGTDATNYVEISAKSRLAWIGGKKLNNLVEQTLLTEAPTYLYPLTEGDGATFASNRTATPGPNLAPHDDAGDTIQFGAGAGPNGEPILFSKRAAPAVAEIAGTGANMVAPAAEWLAVTMVFFHRSAGGLTGGYSLFGASDPLHNLLYVETGNLQVASELNLNANVISDLPSGKTFSNGPRAVGVTYSGAGTKTLRNWIDGADVGSAVQSGTTSVPVGANTIRISAATDPGAADGYLAIWIGRELNATEMAEMAAALLGWAGDLPGNRIERYANVAGIPSTEVAAEDGVTPMAAIDGAGKTIVELMRNVESTEGGVLFDAKDGALTFHARGHRYTAASAFTLSFAQQQVENGYAPTYDRAGVQNDVTAALPGNTAEAHAVDQGSVDDYGQRGDSLTLYTTDANEPHAAAWWRVNTYSEPSVRVPQLAVDFLALTTALQDSVYAAAVGTRFATAARPTQDTASTGDYFIEGWTETYGPESCRFEFNVSDATPYVNTWVLEDATRGEIDATFVIGY